MVPLCEPPFYAIQVWPVVSNTQGGPVHDERQRVLDVRGASIPGLFAAGDYIAGPYPATLEGAVRSGLEAAVAIG